MYSTCTNKIRMCEEERHGGNAAPPIVTTKEHALADLPSEEWQMPEPVYRQSSGHLPRGFEKQFSQHDDTPTAPMPPAAEAKSDIIEELASAPPIEPVLAPGNRPSRLAIAVGVLILLAILGVAALAGLYYLFLAKTAETGF